LSVSWPENPANSEAAEGSLYGSLKSLGILLLFSAAAMPRIGYSGFHANTQTIDLQRIIYFYALAQRASVSELRLTAINPFIGSIRYARQRSN